MNNFRVKKDCSGCGACTIACPNHCITMISDVEGFLYPVTDTLKCNNCDLCEKICPTSAEYFGNKSLVSYAMRSKDSNVRMSSSSGGIFTVLAVSVLRNGGIVFGAAADNMQQIRHICVKSENELWKLCGSKYVQSDVGNSYFEVKKELKNDTVVYFSGTPCQIAGLYAFLRHDYSNLITQDIICHGVPSPLVWKKYIKEKSEKNHSGVREASFREKSKGWERFSMKIGFNNGKNYVADLSKDLYLRGFLNNLFLRPSCYACAFKSEQRLADITLADCWGADRLNVKLPFDQGLSLVSINSIKGMQLFREVESMVESESLSWKAAIGYNCAATESATLNTQRNSFFEKLAFDQPIHKTIRNHLPKNSIINQIVSKLYRIKKRFLHRV